MEKSGAISMVDKPRCSTPGCNNIARVKGICTSCNYLLKTRGTLARKKVQNIPGEIWLPINKTKYHVSSMGRIKTVSRGDEILMSPRLRKLKGDKTGRMVVGNNLYIAHAVLTAHVGNLHNDKMVVYLDGDITNCRLDNLEWYGPGYLITKCIIIAKKATIH